MVALITQLTAKGLCSSRRIHHAHLIKLARLRGLAHRQSLPLSQPDARLSPKGKAASMDELPRQLEIAGQSRKAAL